MIATPERVMVVVAHPDDFEPQCGGTVRRFLEDGSRVRVLTAVVPNLSKAGQVLWGHNEERRFEAIRATEALGVQEHFLLGLNQYELAHIPAFIQQFDEHAFEFDPDLIITHGEVDTQQDHVTVSKIMHTVCRKNRIGLWEFGHSFPGGLKMSRTYPNLFVDITGTRDVKMAACAQYESQVKRYPGWLDGIAARDRYYGWMLNQEGNEMTTHAEGFVVQKMVWP